MSTPNAGGLIAGRLCDGETPVNAGLVDVLLATFNGAKYLVAQLESILSQTHQNFRILVSDDGSSDATMEILHQYRARLGERLILVPNPSAGKGVVRNFENLMVISRRSATSRSSCPHQSRITNSPRSECDRPWVMRTSAI